MLWMRVQPRTQKVSLCNYPALGLQGMNLFAQYPTGDEQRDRYFRCHYGLPFQQPCTDVTYLKTPSCPETAESFHHLADIGYASAAFGISGRTLAAAHALFCKNFFHDHGLAVLAQIQFNVLIGVIETIANQIGHNTPFIHLRTTIHPPLQLHSRFKKGQIPAFYRGLLAEYGIVPGTGFIFTSALKIAVGLRL
jgi:hypothetical protein